MTPPGVQPHTRVRRVIFREAALEQLGAGERLDVLMKVTDTKGWLALIACGVVLASALGWGVFGSVPSKQQASGILIRRAGLADVVGASAGQITAVEVDVGDTVRAGQVIAQLAQPELQAELAGLQKQRAELQRTYATSEQLGGEDAQLRAGLTAQARSGLLSTIAATKQRERELRERLRALRPLAKRQLVTRDTLLAAREALRTAQASLHAMNTELQQIEVTRHAAARTNEAEREVHQARIADNAREIALLEQRLEQASRVTSAYDGRIVALHAAVGDVLGTGQPLASVERAASQDGLEALLYVDSRTSKRIKPGMAVEISPSMAQRERFGVLHARVRTVEEFPSTRRAMLRALRNEQLVDSLLGDTHGVPAAVAATLVVDRSASNGYRWSSRRGATVQLSSGTRCTAAVVTGTQRPLALLFPTLEAVL